MNEQRSNSGIKKYSARLIVYWVFTILLAWELGFGATWDFNWLNQGYVHHIMARLSYPDYVAYILGVGKVLACIAVLVPGYGRLKEWAYAGIFYNFAGALASHVLAHDRPVSFIAPIIFGSITLVSWWLRPEGRKLR